MDDDGEPSPWDCCKSMIECAWMCVQFWTQFSITFILLWLLYRPDRFHPRIDSAVLAALHLTAAAPPPPANATEDQPSSRQQLVYDLAVDLSFRNAHRRLSIRYLDVGATAFYGDTKLGPADDALPLFRQGPKNTTVTYII